MGSEFDWELNTETNKTTKRGQIEPAAKGKKYVCVFYSRTGWSKKTVSRKHEKSFRPKTKKRKHKNKKRL